MNHQKKINNLVKINLSKKNLNRTMIAKSQNIKLFNGHQKKILLMTRTKKLPKNVIQKSFYKIHLEKYLIVVNTCTINKFNLITFLMKNNKTAKYIFKIAKSSYKIRTTILFIANKILIKVIILKIIN